MKPEAEFTGVFRILSRCLRQSLVFSRSNSSGDTSPNKRTISLKYFLAYDLSITESSLEPLFFNLMSQYQLDNQTLFQYIKDYILYIKLQVFHANKLFDTINIIGLN